MSISYTEDQSILRTSLMKFLHSNYSFGQRKSILDSEDGYSRDVWRGLAELGLLGLTFSTEDGGFGGTPIDVHIVMETLGRFLLVEPFIPTVIAAGGLLRHGASSQQKSAFIPKIMRGELICAVGLFEPDGRYNLASVGTQAISTAEGFRISGVKSVVCGAPQADRIFVTARVSGSKREKSGISLFVVDSTADGIAQRAYSTVDGKRASEVILDNVLVKRVDMIGKLGAAYDLIDTVMDETISAICSESVGAMASLNERVVDYCGTRSAFGNTLAQFQVIRHRLVDMRIAYEHALGMAYRAAEKLTAQNAEQAAAVSAAKVQVFKEAHFVASNAIQLHGAIGMTDELDVGHYFRRIASLETTGGDCEFHLKRFADLMSLRSHSSALSDVELGELSDTEMEFQRTVRKFLQINLTDDMRRAARFTTWAFAEFEEGSKWQKIMSQNGWGAPHWPSEFGGANWSPAQKLIWSIECLRAGAPMSMNMGRDLVAPCLIEFGTNEQRAEFLPAILNGEDWWAQGFSEPQAGSDLAALQMSAEDDGDDYVVNGSKSWTTFAQHANRVFCLVRTGKGRKKQMGISVLLIDLDSPGIDIRPLTNIAGEDDFNQIFFTDVRVPKSRLLGEENNGWNIVRYLLRFEHGLSVAAGTILQQNFWQLRDIMEVEPDGFGGTLADSEVSMRALAELLIEIQAVAYLDRELIAASLTGRPPSEIGEIITVRSREVGQKLNKMAMLATGQYSRPFQKNARTVGTGATIIGPDHSLMPMPYYLAQLASKIAGGTQEVRKNNIARSLLRLPS